MNEAEAMAMATTTERSWSPLAMGNSIQSIEAYIHVNRTQQETKISQSNTMRDNNQPNKGIERHVAMVNDNWKLILWAYFIESIRTESMVLAKVPEGMVQIWALKLIL
jgi:hypothetical protein